MNVDLSGFYQIAIALAEHFDSMYYVHLETGKFVEFVAPKMLDFWNLDKNETNFFKLAKNAAENFVHPDDSERILKFHERESIISNLSNKKSVSSNCRLIIDGKVIHARYVFMKCDDEEHVLFCIENVEAEYQEKAEQRKTLLSAERMARRDELTGIKNKNAFTEESQTMDKRIKNESHHLKFALVVCDLNNLKLMNDTRGHSFGDEAIQSTSRMICNVFSHSPVFRIGGDEFVALLFNHDYEERDRLLEDLINQSYENKKTRTGPVIACGMAVFDADKDKEFADVFNRADSLMYENKKESKGLISNKKTYKKIVPNKTPITDERKRLLDGLFGSFMTIAGDGYVFLDDMKYDFSRWALSLINDFGMESEYMYAAEKIWEKYIHPDDLKMYQEVIGKILSGKAEVHPLDYRVRKPDGKYIPVTFRGFVLNDNDGKPDYFGGIIIPK
ncbi:MAG: diguanylate cyclase [Treponema sp.]|nr:diguanylate cyclase [Treponema sp.]